MCADYSILVFETLNGRVVALKNFKLNNIPRFHVVGEAAKRTGSEALRLYHTYPAMITLIIAGLATCCLLGVAILQEKEIKALAPIPQVPLPEAILVKSPNSDPRPDFGYVNTVVIHVLEESVPTDYHKQIRNPRSRFGVHYTIAPEGNLYSHVEENHRAWHTPMGILPNRIKQVNAFSIGIGLLQTPRKPLAENSAQLATLDALLRRTMKRYVIIWFATASQVSRDIRTDYLDALFPFDQFRQYEDKFLYPLPGTVDNRKERDDKE